VLDCGTLGLKLRLEVGGLEPLVILMVSWFPEPCVWPERIPGAQGMLEVFGEQMLLSWVAAKFFRYPEAIRFERLGPLELAFSRFLERPPEGYRWEGIAWDCHSADGERGLWRLQAVQAVPLSGAFSGRKLLGALCRFFGAYNGKQQ